jgi:hypothetical protein
MNAARAYFGGDISADVARLNAYRYKDHLNKVSEPLWMDPPPSSQPTSDQSPLSPFQPQPHVPYPHNPPQVFAFWDLVACPIPQWRTTCDPTPRPFDAVMLRDVLQHMHINNAVVGGLIDATM